MRPPRCGRGARRANAGNVEHRCVASTPMTPPSAADDVRAARRAHDTPAFRAASRERDDRIEVRAGNGPNAKMSATSAPPVASALASSASPTLPGNRPCAMMPDPTTTASSNAVPTASAATRQDQLDRHSDGVCARGHGRTTRIISTKVEMIDLKKRRVNSTPALRSCRPCSSPPTDSP